MAVHLGPVVAISWIRLSSVVAHMIAGRFRVKFASTWRLLRDFLANSSREVFAQFLNELVDQDGPCLNSGEENR